MMGRGLLFCIALLAVMPAFAASRDVIIASGEKRVALVIGNAAYVNAAALKNPVNDARAMAAALRAQGFDVIARENTTKAQMEKAIVEFGDKLGEGAVGLVYYSGHGLQVAGKNYLIPVDAEIATERMVPLVTVDADNILTQMMDARSRVNLVILDACRNNPFERSFRALGGGLAQMNAPQGTMIAYATAPGKVASDGAGTNGLYTQELLKAMRRPGLKVEEVFKEVRVAVSAASNNNQIPWEASSLTGDFYFQGSAASAGSALSNDISAPSTNSATDLAFWDAVKNAKNPDMFREYLNQFPNGQFAGLANLKIAEFQSAPIPPQPQQMASLTPPPKFSVPGPDASPIEKQTFEKSLVGNWTVSIDTKQCPGTAHFRLSEVKGTDVKVRGDFCSGAAGALVSAKINGNTISFTHCGAFNVVCSDSEGDFVSPTRVEGDYLGHPFVATKQ